MRTSQLVAAVVIAATFLVGLGALVTLALSLLALSSHQLATVVVVVLAVMYILATSALGGRSRRWLSNPYW